MSENNGTILKEAAEYAKDFLSKNLPSDLHFHNLKHTEEVVAAAEEISRTMEISDEDIEVVQLAAWFHDTGYCKKYTGHEMESVRIAEEFLREKGYPEDKIKKVKSCILSTEYQAEPKNDLEMIMSDSDLYHLATDRFFEKSENLKKELLKYKIKGEMDERDWMQMNLFFIKHHHYHTPYGKEVLDKGRQKNTKALKKKIKSLSKEDKEIQKLKAENEKLRSKLEKVKSKENKPDRGIETMFRTTSKNHLELSAIADNKANIMISINAIIISILMSVMIRKFEDYPNLVIPTILLVSVSLATIVFAVLATRPNITKGKFTRDDILNQRTNLLFFGNFFKMELKEYEWGINQLMTNSNLLYGSMTKDIYFLGKVLGRKYKLLRTAYTVFMFGLVISVLAYGAALIFFPVYH
jgi:predicted metal-dependent HD superfamily phosphohydrolase